jgi:osmotically-inducible protein OsmY
MRPTRNLLTLALALATTFAMGQMYPGQSGSQPGTGRPGTPQTFPGHPGADNQTTGQTTTDTDRDQDRDRDKDKDRDHDRKASKADKNVKVDDSTLERQVHEQLATRAEFSNVQVRVKDGVVHLEGSVPRKEDRKEVKNLAESIPGVRGVKEKLTINANAGASASNSTGAAAPGSSTEPYASSGTVAGSTAGQQSSSAAGTTTGAAGQAQSGSSAAAPSSAPLSGSASGETATATGSTSTQSSTTGGVAGTTTSGQNAGVSGSANTGAIGSSAQQGTAGASGTATETPSAGASATTGQGNTAASGSMSANSSDTSMLQGQIQTALQREPTLASDNVNVNISGDEVVLTGSVATGKEKQTARRIAQSYAGNRRVVDHLTVTGRGHGANVNKGNEGMSTGSSGAIGSQPSSSTGSSSGMGTSTEKSGTSTGTGTSGTGQNPPDQNNPRPDQTNNPR